MSLSNFTTSHLQADADLNPSAVSVLRYPVFDPVAARSHGPESHKEITMNARLHLFSIYTELGAYRRIRWAVNTIAKLAGQHWQCSSEMWKLDASNASELMRHMLASDGAKADVLIVVMRALERRTPEMVETVEWLDSLAPLSPDRAGLLIGLLGDEDNKTEELDWTTRELTRCAQKTNRKFIWNWMGRYATEDADWLTNSVGQLLARNRTVAEPRAWQEEVHGRIRQAVP
jgi:hypothetical protein